MTRRKKGKFSQKYFSKPEITFQVIPLESGVGSDQKEVRA